MQKKKRQTNRDRDQIRIGPVRDGEWSLLPVEHYKISGTIGDAPGWFVRVGLDDSAEPVTLILARQIDDANQTLQQLEAEGNADPERLSSTLLRKIRIGELLDGRDDQPDIGLRDLLRVHVPDLPVRSDSSSPSNRTRWDLAALTEFAAAYVENAQRNRTETGRRRVNLRQLGDQFGVGDKRARDLAVRCRKLDLLSPTRQGRSDSELTQKARAILANRQQGSSDGD